MIILLNGPPGSGKDTAAEFIILALGNSKVHHDKFSKPMKSSLIKIFDIIPSDIKTLEQYKEIIRDDWGGLSWRGMQISMYEYLAKTYGDDILGHLFMRRNRNNASIHTVVSDCGLNLELIPITDVIPYGHVGLIRLSREGCSYDTDIREYVEGRNIKYIEDINNEYDLELFQAQIKRVLRKWELLDDKDN